ncbi:hypothetical protein DAPPUDRAFT_325397 [Daphnia pulex]|uniref:G-protein coupled receptors family 1 profile domain-containing protein n=1 Tax=Daphnia pulex TaxID=6669 RepID=E9H4L1_DAPPU|nr:hypothetical protein DAPPUDRAFT_325397 [Daphnia pulex]|eukprot:EFX73329.1 hypothetical protein DAPPUDRAFT_325397 [Daphnia pulex]
MNNTSSNQEGDHIIDPENNDEYNPIDPVFFLIIVKCVCCLIGIPLNVSIIVTIIRYRQFRSKPRKIFLLGIFFSNLSFFAPALIKLIYWGFYPVESLCKTYVALVGLPQSLLLSNMLLALVDRYLAINHPWAHREKMTVRLACLAVVISSALIVFLLKFVYIAGLVPLRCQVLSVHSNILAAILVTLFLSCIAMNFIVYRQTKIHLRRDSRTLSPQGTNEETQEIPLNDRSTRGSASFSLNDHLTNNMPMSIHVDRRKSFEMEIEATFTLIIGVASLFVTVFPMFILLFIIMMCQLVYNEELECSNLTWLMTYFKELGSIHAVYSPLIFLVRNKELRVVLFDCFQ